MTTVAHARRFVPPASTRRHCAATSTDWSSSRSRPNGGGGRYHAPAPTAARRLRPLETRHAAATDRAAVRACTALNAAREGRPGGLALPRDLLARGPDRCAGFLITSLGLLAQHPRL